MVVDGKICAKLRVCQESKRPQTVVEGYQGNTLASKLRTIESVFRPSTSEISTTVDPQHHRLLSMRITASRPNVEIQAVFALFGLANVKGCAKCLRADRPKPFSMSNTVLCAG